MTVLDYIDRIEVPGDVFREPANEYWALICLRQGLVFINQQVAKCSELVRQRVNPNGRLQVFLEGNAPDFKGIPMGLVTCSFHWYAVTACQYVRMVGAIAQTHDRNRPLPNEYVKRVIPEVLAFRDKIAAHFAWTMKNSHDCDADRKLSCMPQLSFQEDAFHVGGMKLTLKASGRTSDSERIGPWSVAHVHERLRERYWPDQETDA